MRTFERVFGQIKPFSYHQENGHAEANRKNKKSLTLAKKEIESMFKKGKTT